MNGYLRVKTRIDNSEIKKDISLLEEKLAQLNQEQEAISDSSPYEKQNDDLIKVRKEIENCTRKLEKLKNIQEEQKKADLNKITSQIDDIGKGVQNTVETMSKWTMAIFAVHSAYGAVRKIINSVSNYNNQVATDIEYIGFALSSIFESAVKKIISLIMTLLQYINYVAKAWFNVDLFAKASAKSFSKAAKEAKKMSNYTTSFDEMTIANSNDSSGTSDMSIPSVDLSNQLPEGEVPEWLKWIAENKEKIIKGLIGIGTAIGAIKLINFISNLESVNKVLGILFGWIQTVGASLTGLQIGGIALIVGGIVLLIKDIITFLQDPTWEQFGQILIDIGIIVAGFALLFASWPLAIAAVLIAVVGLIVKYWDEIVAFLTPIGEWIYNNILLPIFDFIKNTINSICSIVKLGMSIVTGIFTAATGLLLAPFQILIQTVTSVFSNIKIILANIKSLFTSIFTGDLKGVLTSFKNIFKAIFDSLFTIAKSPINLIIKGVNSLISGLNKIQFDVPDWVPTIGGKKLGFNIPKLKELGTGGIVTKPTPVITGEAGKEAVLPLENNLGYLDKFAEIIASKSKTNDSSGYYIVEVDGNIVRKSQARRRKRLVISTNGRGD